MRVVSRVVSGLASAVLVWGLVGCGGSGDGASGVATTAGAANAAGSGAVATGATGTDPAGSEPSAGGDCPLDADLVGRIGFNWQIVQQLVDDDRYAEIDRIAPDLDGEQFETIAAQVAELSTEGVDGAGVLSPAEAGEVFARVGELVDRALRYEGEFAGSVREELLTYSRANLGRAVQSLWHYGDANGCD